MDKPAERKRREGLQDPTQKKKDVGIQSIIPPRDYIPPAIAATHRLSLLDFPRFLYMPHTVSFLILGMIIVLFLAFRSNEDSLPFLYYVRRYIRR